MARRKVSMSKCVRLAQQCRLDAHKCPFTMCGNMASTSISIFKNICPFEELKKPCTQIRSMDWYYAIENAWAKEN